MLEYMLDTNLCVRVLREQPAHIGKRLLKEADAVCISSIVLHELYLGAELSARMVYQSELAEEFAARLVVLDFDHAAARHAANIRADLTRRGQMIGANDLLIAGHARSLGLKLVTGNLKEFTRVEGLRCEDWVCAAKTGSELR
jgi:tRNA(fMet)-specific endonuclease VapC